MITPRLSYYKNSWYYAITLQEYECSSYPIHILAAMAQFERQRISERIKEALKAKKEREPEWKPGTSALDRCSEEEGAPDKP